MRRFLRGLGEAVKGALSVSATTKEVGKEAAYYLSGFVPGSKVYWSSYKNGESTGELNADYGHVIEANGTKILKWTPGGNDVGNWTKIALVIAPDGTQTTYPVNFRVIETPQASAPVYVDTSSDFWGTPLFNLGGFEVTPMIAAAAAGAFFLLKKR